MELQANYFDSWGNLGDAYRWSSGKKEKAKQAYQHAIQLVREEIIKHPDQMDLRTNLAMYLAKSGEKESALRELKPVEQAHAKNCGNRDKALDLLLAAVKTGQSLADAKNEPEFVSLRADPRYHLTILAASAVRAKR